MLLPYGPACSAVSALTCMQKAPPSPIPAQILSYFATTPPRFKFKDMEHLNIVIFWLHVQVKMVDI